MTVAESSAGEIVDVTDVVSPYLMVASAGVRVVVLKPRSIVTVTVLVSDNQLFVCGKTTSSEHRPTPRVVIVPELVTEQTELEVVKTAVPSPLNVAVGVSVLPTPNLITFDVPKLTDQDPRAARLIVKVPAE